MSALALQHDLYTGRALAGAGEEMPFVCRDAVETPEVVARAHGSKTPLDESKPDDLVPADHGSGGACRRAYRDPASQELRTPCADLVKKMSGVDAGVEDDHVLAAVAKRDDEIMCALAAGRHRDGHPLRCMRTGTLGGGPAFG